MNLIREDVDGDASWGRTLVGKLGSFLLFSLLFLQLGCVNTHTLYAKRLMLRTATDGRTYKGK